MSGAIELLPHLVEISSHALAHSRPLQPSAKQLIANLLDRSASRKDRTRHTAPLRWPASSTAASSPHDAQWATIALQSSLATQIKRHCDPGCTQRGGLTP